MKWALILIVGVLLVSGCTGMKSPEEASYKNPAATLCKELCQAELHVGEDLSNGPCLSDDNPEWDIEDWVCDVAHNPREPVDNLPENQCQDFREGKAKHFVEVNPNCEFIKAV